MTNERVPSPYMDEPFHVAQARHYCAGNFNEWNPKITTPPLLYLLVPLFNLCGGAERFTNSVLFPIAFVCLCRLRRFLRRQKIGKTSQFGDQQQQHFVDAYVSALAVLSLPVLLDTSLLFYTDLLSLTLLALALSLSDRPFPMFSVFVLALFVRQTNIVWLFFSAFPIVWHSLRSFLQGQMSLYQTAIFLIRRLWPHALLCACFIVFLFLNGGSVVLGDRSAHRPVLHVPQVLYFCAFAAASAFPHFANYIFCFFREYFRGKKRGISVSLLRFSLPAALFVAFSLFSIVHLFTLEHPYLLADNRHFTFYIWQRIFQRHWLVKYALVPVYAICAVFIWHTMETDTVTKVAFAVSTSACLVPAHLLEFRYFVVPFAVWRLLLNYRNQPRWILCAELALHFVVNAIALHLFFNRPFRWASEPEQWQRFMW
ncbi:hypothetical protein niasHS_000985 [Heterodera schachtii]|uniref:Dol-P-Glc:Glc(2)Man(9)GlcNAc(2)-PP-Dol alpha-1,2-glucosyltransferase n=1 Tax=Heterodera schachtii TaxID=97005 RepID=A0ABD2K811_HETSC